MPSSSILRTFAIATGALLVPSLAAAQIPYDPPTATRPEPNVMVVIDATRTTLIDGGSCGGACHVEGQVSPCGTRSDHSGTLYYNGQTRLQLARRVLTGGWGWNTNVVVNGQSADARIRTDGVMDTYKVRWGVAWYDGLGTRIALDPTVDNDLAQRTVIDFRQPSNEDLGEATLLDGRPLNSWLPFYRTTQCCGNQDGSATDCTPETIPWFNDAGGSGGRMGRALKYVRDYWRTGQSPTRFSPPASASGFLPAAPISNIAGAGTGTGDGQLIDNDVSNVLVSAPPAGCRRNITILMSDGEGAGNHDAGDGNGNQNVGAFTNQIYNLSGPGGGALPASLRNQVFAIHFGTAPGTRQNMDPVADLGFDGSNDNFPQAFEGAPGGVITTLAPMLAAFSSIFSLVLSGTYIGAAPTVTRYGDHMAVTKFEIRSCEGTVPTACNIGRPGQIEWVRLNATTGASAGVEWNAGRILRTRRFDTRNLFTTVPDPDPDGDSGAATESNCGFFASCSIPDSQRATLVRISNAHGWGSVADFIRGDPSQRFANDVQRGDSDGNGTIDDPYKLADVANSRPVIVGAPAGIGEDVERWKRFLDVRMTRFSGTNGDGSTNMLVKERDQVMYVGGNDGFLHAFLTGRFVRPSATNPSEAGRTATYTSIGTACPANADASQVANSPRYCDGAELWGYSPRFIQRNWPSLRSGHYYMVDGTPVVEDVLFTKERNNPGALCPAAHRDDCANWEYRTVLVQCLGAGGPGCFAMDVTNPYDPQLLWEREFTDVTGRGTSTSRPVIVRVKRMVSGIPIPYYVAVMGGGLNEVGGGSRKGSFIAVGLENGRVFTTSSPAAAGAPAEADFAGSPTCLDADNDSYIDTCYITTTQASVYKIRFIGGNPDASTGQDGGIQMEKFFDARAYTGVASLRSYSKIVATFEADNSVALFYGTGNFEGIQLPGETNYFFKIKDSNPRNIDLSALTTARNESRINRACNAVNGTAFRTVDNRTGALQLAAGEKVIFDPILVGGTVFFTSYSPDSNPCVRGNSYLYGVRFDTCGNGIIQNSASVQAAQNAGQALPAPDQSKLDVGQGLATQPIVNERTGTVYVANDRGTIDSNSARSPPLIRVPMFKVFWREVLSPN